MRRWALAVVLLLAGCGSDASGNAADPATTAAARPATTTAFAPTTFPQATSGPAGTTRPAATTRPTTASSATTRPAGTTRPAATTRPTGVSGLATVTVAQLPAEARVTLTLIAAGGPFPYAQDGAVFENRERLLPGHPRGWYHEYTVETPGEDDRGARRIVTGEAEERYYTADHYDSFREVVGT